MSDHPRRPTGPDEPDRVVIRDKRRIDPVSGQARAVIPDAAIGSDPGGGAGPGGAGPGGAGPGGAGPGDGAGPGGDAGPDKGPGAVSALQAAVAERTADLQRVQAEYANYRKRTDRDRLVAGDVAVSRVLIELLPVLDDIDRARTHGDLTGALKAVDDHLEGIVGKLGLHPFGEVGDPFDPALHEAVLHTESDDVAEPTCTIVMRRGYQHGARLLRPAMVGVSEPATHSATATSDPVTAPMPAAPLTSETTIPQAGETPPDGDPGPEAHREPGSEDE